MDSQTVYLSGGPCDGETRNVAIWIQAIEIAQPIEPASAISPDMWNEVESGRVDVRSLIPKTERARYVRLSDTGREFVFQPAVH